MYARLSVLLAVVAVPVLLVGCNPSLVKEGDPLHAYVGKEYYLNRPLTGPKYRHDNVFGTGQMIAAGTPVNVLSIERSLPIYRVYFSGPESCPHGRCEAHWRLDSDDAFQARFQELFAETNPLDGLEAKPRELVEKHQIASNMTPEEVRMSIGAPNSVREQEDGEHWIYERRQCDVKGRLVAIPHLALVFKDGKLAEANDLDASEWYVTSEPQNKLSGLCEGITPLPEDTPVRPAQAGEMDPGADRDWSPDQ